MGVEGLGSGDTIRAAAGTYDRGGVYSDVGSNRVEVKEGVMLIGAGADVTTVKGAPGSGENGIGPGERPWGRTLWTLAAINNETQTLF